METVFKQYPGKTYALPEGEIEGRFSVREVDRYGELVEPEAFRKHIYKFQKNAKLLWAHQHNEIPLGSITQIHIGENDLSGRAKLAIKENPKSKIIYDMIKAGHGPSAFSIGFQPIKWDTDWKIPEGQPNAGHVVNKRYTEADLLEISLVNIPASPSSLVVQKAYGIDLSEVSLKMVHTKQGEKELLDFLENLELEELVGRAEESKNWVHWPVRPASDFREDSFRTIPFNESEGIFSLRGKLKDPPAGQDGSMVLRKWLFSKKPSFNWTKERARQWAEVHSKSIEEMSRMELEIALREVLPDVIDDLKLRIDRQVVRATGKILFDDEGGQ